MKEQEKTYKIYKHTLIENCLEKGKSYIGQTCSAKVKYRWNSGRGYKRCTTFWKAIKDHGGLAMWNINWKHELLEINIKTVQQANIREKYWIAKFHTWVDDPLCWGYNSDNGGNNKITSLETRIKLSKALKGKKFTAEHCKNLSLGSTIKKAIICIETSKQFESIKQGETMLGLCRGSIINCLTNRNKTAGGYHWAYLKDYTKQEALKYFIGRKPQYYNKSRSVLCIETGKVFESLSVAMKTIGRGISDCLHNRTHTAYGYHWAYADDSARLKKLYKFKNCSKIVKQKIQCIETGKIFNNLTEAMLKYGRAISNCVNGHCKTAYGYHWKKIAIF